MTRMTFLPLAAMAALMLGCERHPASELAGEHAFSTENHEGGHHRESAPEAAAPAAETPKAPVAAPAEKGPAPAYFPEAK